jgi:twitching motility protein PilI
MAKKEALRDLQSRLAERLQAARQEGVSAAWLAVRVGQDHYLFPLAQSGEIFPLAAMASVPYAKPWFMGVVNLRGGLFGVIDLARFIRGPDAPARAEQAWSQTRLVTFNAELEVNGALLIDALIGLRRQDAFVRAAPAPEGSPNFFGQRLVDAQEVFWQEINLQLLAQNPEFLAIGA